MVQRDWFIFINNIEIINIMTSMQSIYCLVTLVKKMSLSHVVVHFLT